MKHLKQCAAVIGLVLAASSQAATIEIQNRDAPGQGFNDPTPVAPVGGNTGRTLGEQRMNVYRHVANIWARHLDSNVTITVNAGWEALDCNSTGAILGSASPHNMWYSFPGALLNEAWYPQALANKLAGQNLAKLYQVPDDGTGYGNVDIVTQFNVNLGAAGCLDGSTFYLGLDGKTQGSQIDFAPVLLHELGHGLGFSLLSTDGVYGDRLYGMPSVWEYFMYDNTTGKFWRDMTSSEISASGTNPHNVVWTGPNTVSAVPQVLSLARVATLQVGGVSSSVAAGPQEVGEASFGSALTSQPFSGLIGMFADQTTGQALACKPLSTANAALVAGKIALIDRGSCPFTDKVKNAQTAGARAVLVVDNVVEAVGTLGGSDASVTIPAVMVTKRQGDAIKAALMSRVRGKPAPQLTASMSASISGHYAGADRSGRPMLFTPSAYSPGSSVSHWDVALSPDQLMEPYLTPGLSLTPAPPKDLTLPLLKDLGW